ncbi:helix-turn-helix domain-containing protein [Halobaculum sp. MBLA0147]|uniref:helix-turn-helix domain-containing protein n=1 Tax=Halobaculum sp. MBLA0147 TaxID=3079934 RepID=UPI0035263C24
MTRDDKTTDDVAGETPTQMRQVTLRIRHYGEPESDVSAAFPSVTLRSVSSMTGSGDRRKRIIELQGDPDKIRAFVSEFRETESIITAEPLSPLSRNQVYVIFVYDVTTWDSISELLRELGVHYKVGTTISAGWERWTIYLEDPNELSQVMDHLRAGGNDVELVSNVEMSELSSPGQLHVDQMLGELTTRQRDALAAAIAIDYYGYDGDGAIADVADVLGVAETTAWEHLSRAEGKVMRHVGRYLNQQ